MILNYFVENMPGQHICDTIENNYISASPCEDYCGRFVHEKFDILTHLPLNKMGVISQTIFSDAFSLLIKKNYFD